MTTKLWALPRIYGSDAAKAGARQWMQRHAVKLVAAGVVCQHRLIRMRCPDRFQCAVLAGDAHRVAFDHANIWEDTTTGQRFMLAHVYVARDIAGALARPFAEARGLTVRIDDAADWYGFDTTPLRYDPKRRTRRRTG